MAAAPRALHGSVRVSAALLLVLLLLVAPACVVGVATPASGPATEPPLPREETPPPAPRDCSPECRWSPGYWHWDGIGNVWVAGHWERRRSLVETATGGARD